MSFINGGMHVMMRMTHGIIALAPVGIGALVGYTVAVSGPRGVSNSTFERSLVK